MNNQLVELVLKPPNRKNLVYGLVQPISHYEWSRSDSLLFVYHCYIKPLSINCIKCLRIGSLSDVASNVFILVDD